MRQFRVIRVEKRESLESLTNSGCRTKRVLALHCGDRLKIGGQAAIAIDGDESLAGLKMRPYVEPNVPL